MPVERRSMEVSMLRLTAEAALLAAMAPMLVATERAIVLLRCCSAKSGGIP